jgi:hypothetical protein
MNDAPNAFTPRPILSGSLRKARKRKFIMSHMSCPICLAQKPDGMVYLRDGTQVCKKCGHVIFPVGSGFQCECIRCIELRNPSSPDTSLLTS